MRHHPRIPGRSVTLTKEQDEEKKDNNKWRRELRDKLLKFTARIMYLTDEREATLVAVINPQQHHAIARGVLRAAAGGTGRLNLKDKP